VHALRVTVCELPDDRTAFERAWRQLVGHVKAEQSDLLVLPEMPFASWLAVSPDFDRDAWERAVLDHETWFARFPDLAPAAVVSSRPVTRDGRRLNEGFAWSSGDGYRRVHDKRFLPDEEGYWEARWYEPGDGTFDVCEIAGARAGMLICTEMWSFSHAQAYGRVGAQLVLTPRATGRPTVDKWLTGGVVRQAACHSSYDTSVTGWWNHTPALLTSTSMPPSAPAASSTMRRTASGSAMSAWTTVWPSPGSASRSASASSAEAR
jgi:N-carbamoylputrescine amidase